MAAEREAGAPVIGQTTDRAGGAGGALDQRVAGGEEGVEFVRGLAREREARRAIRASICAGVVPGFLDRRTPARNLGAIDERPGSRVPIEEGREIWPASFAARTVERKLLGLNHLKTWYQYIEKATILPATKYGSAGEQFADASLLGADLVRQFGTRDLLWSFLLPRGHPRTTTDLTTGDPIPLLSATPSLPDGEERVEELRELLDEARDHGVKLSLTFLTQGLGSYRLSHVPDGYEGEDYFHEFVGIALDTTSCQQVTWHKYHDGAVDHETPPACFPRRDDPTDYWHFYTLDGSAPYKRAYLGYLAEAATAVLLGAAGDVERVGEVVESIELFNEVESRSVYETVGGSALYDPETTGGMWGRACAWAARGFRRSLPTPSIRIGLPGILSHDHREVGSSDPMSWEARLAHLRGLVRGMTHELLDSRIKDVEPLDLISYIQGVDLHYYHADAGLERHIGYLPLEVAEVFGAVGEGLADGLSQADYRDPEDFPSYGQPVLDAFRVTVLETGCSADPRSGKPPEFATAEAFQAFEVWRRLGAILASPARVAGWHAWMSSQGGNFSGYGLRKDLGGSDDPPSEAVQRRSWFAFQRLAETLGDATAGRMLLPAVADRAGLTAFLSGPEAHGYVVFEYQRLDRAFPWAYLVLVDPVAPGVYPETLRDRLGFLVPSSSARAQRLGVEPTGFSHSSGRSSLPTLSAVYAAPSDLPLGVPLRLRRGDPPVLILARAPIAWEVVSLVRVHPGVWDLGRGPDVRVHPGVGDLGRGGTYMDPDDAVGFPGMAALGRGAPCALHLEVPDWLDDPTLPIPPAVKTRGPGRH